MANKAEQEEIGLTGEGGLKPMARVTKIKRILLEGLTCRKRLVSPAIFKWPHFTFWATPWQ